MAACNGRAETRLRNCSAEDNGLEIWFESAPRRLPKQRKYTCSRSVGTRNEGLRTVQGVGEYHFGTGSVGSVNLI